MKYLIKLSSSFILLIISQSSFVQKQPVRFSIRVEGQTDFQKEAFALGFPGIITTHKETTFNYGLDNVLIVW